MVHRAAPITVLVALGHTSVNAVKATAGDWSTGSSACLTLPLHSLLASARREDNEYRFKILWYDSAGARAHDLPVVGQTLYRWTITPVIIQYNPIQCSKRSPLEIRASFPEISGVQQSAS